MSKTKYNWWGFVKNIIRKYPDYCRELESIREQKITANYSATAHGSGVSKPVETLALRELPKAEQKQYDAVVGAISMTKRLKDGEERLKLIDMVFWKKTRNLQGAAMVCNVSYGTAKRWHKEFIISTALCYGELL